MNKNVNDESNDVTHSQIPTKNLKDLETYLDFLVSNDNEKITYLWMDNNSKGPISSTLCASKQEVLSQGNAATSGTLHILINSSSNGGRKIKDIESSGNVRVFVVDLDTVTPKETLKEWITTYNVSLIVESSPGKYHLYWSASPIIPFKRWKIIQSALAQIFGGDTSFNQVNKVIRAPGICRITKSGELFTPKIVYFNPDHTQLEESNLADTFGDINFYYGEYIKKEKKLRELTRETIRSGVLAGKFDQGTGRNNFLYRCVSEAIYKFPSGDIAPKIDEALAFGEQINSQFDVPLEEFEFRKCIESAFSHGFWCWEEKNERNLSKINKMLGLLDDPTDHTTASLELKKEETNGHHDHGGDLVQTFNYDYSDPIFKLNRFTDVSVAVRAIQKHGEKVVQVGTSLYAFDEKESVWVRQHPNASLLYSFCVDAAVDTTKDPLFLKELCTTDSGEISSTKIKRAQERFMSASFIRNTQNLFKNSTSFKHLSLHDFDKNPYLLYCQNGVVDLLTGEIREVEPTDYLLNKCPVIWKKDAKCPWFEKFVREVFEFNEDPEKTEKMCLFMQELFGYSLTGSIDAQKIFIHSGSGANGKSKILSALSAICGSYTGLIACQSLTKSKTALSKEFERITVAFEGKRVVIIDDLDVATQWNEGVVKNLTAPTLVSRKLYSEMVNIPNRAKVHIGTNEVPSPEAENKGILRRMCIIPYPREFEVSDEKEKEIHIKIQEQLPGILQWAVIGLHRTMFENGGCLRYPNEVLECVEDYKENYFTGHTLIRTIVEPTEQDIWVFLEDIAKEVKSRTGQNLSNEKIGHMMTSEFPKIIKSRRRKNGRSIQAYRCIIKNEAISILD